MVNSFSSLSLIKTNRLPDELALKPRVNIEKRRQMDILYDIFRMD